MTTEIKGAVDDLVRYIGTPEECADCETSIESDGLPCGLHSVLFDVVCAVEEAGE